ncbi:MAG: hypothetical protein H0T79_05630 [Deltaproteobacteria bacterium]|nr:hypothetical protein [Deltaproteobacteria bacterium]
MRTRLSGLFLILCGVGVGAGATSCKDDKPGNNPGLYECDDGQDNDADGLVDFPDDPGCISASDDSEITPAMAQCADGRDNDMDGKTDYPNDPGCFAPQQDDEIDDCPDGPDCPQCGNNLDDDGNGVKDFPGDQGCTAASDNDEFTRNLAACGSGVTIKPLPGNNTDSSAFTAGQASNLMSTCGGAGGEVIYELRITEPKVLVATTDTGATAIDTVLYVRGADCASAASELTCNDDVSTSNMSSTITVSLDPGTYYLVVDAADNSIGGSFDLLVQFFVGEGVPCASGDDCGPGLLCRVPAGDTIKRCSQPVCNDGLDDDADSKMDFPGDPGCTSPTDDTEDDDCPTGPNCPECADTDDNDGDGMTDYPADLQCQSASSSAEACVSSEAVATITTAMTMGTTVGATNNFAPACGSTSGHTAPDITYRLDLPLTTSLSIDAVNGSPSFSNATELLGVTCAGAALQCETFGDPIVATNLPAGTYYYVVDGYSTGSGPYTVNISGTIAPGASCEGALATSGALTCGPGYACKGTAGARVCGPALCNDNMDNDGDGKKDFPFDPGCASSADDTETDTCPGAGCPVCSDTMDNDTDTTTDFPADYGCASAAGTSEVFCMPETDPTALITAPVTNGTTVGLANNLMPGCSLSSSAPDKTYALSLPVPVASMQIDTIGSGYDTQLSLRDASCATLIVCDDDSGGSLRSKIVQTNMAAGNYAIEVDGYSSSSGTFILNVKGTVAPMTACTSPLFAAGVLVCPTGTTCQTGTCKP